MLAFGLAGFRAGGRNCFVNDLGVAVGRDLRLCSENLITNRAVLAFGHAGSRASGRNCFVSDLGVPVGRDFLLCNENCITDRAVLSLSLAGFRAGGRNCFVNDLGVAVGFALRDLTNRAGFRSCAGSILPLVPVGRDRLRLGRITGAAGEGLFAGSGASCGGGDSAIVPSVPLGFALRDLTDRAGLRNCAGSILPLVPAGCNLFGFLCIAALSLASASLFAFFCAGCSLGHAPFTKSVPESVAVSRAADRAGFRSCAGSILPLVTVGRDRLRLGLFTDAAGEGLFAGSGAGCRGGDSAVVPGVSASLPAGLEGQVGKGEKLLSVPLFIFKLVWFIPYRFTHLAGNQPAIEKLSLRGSKAALRQHVVFAGASVWNLHRVHRPRAATCVKGNGQLFKLIELRRKIHIFVGIKAPAISLAIPRHPPVCKFIGVILVLGPCGSRIRIRPVIPRGPIFTGVIPLLQDSAVPVEPTDMIFVQRPLRIEGAIPAKRDRRLIRIGRPATVRRCVPAGKIIVRTGKGIGNQGCRRVWLHGLGTHAAFAAVGAEGNNRLLCPLRIKCSVFREGSGCLIIIGRTGAIRRRIPAGKGVVCISKAVTRQGDILSRRAALGGHRSRAAVGIEGNGDRRRFAAPSVVFVFDLGALRIVIRLLIAAVPIAQLGRGDGDLRIIWRPVVLNTLIGFAAFAKLALLNIYAGALAGADICAALRGVDGSRRRQRAVDIDGGV